MSAATNYVQCMDDSYNYFSQEDPLEKVQATLHKVADKKYTALLATHQKDYHSLYDRMRLNLGNLPEAPRCPYGQFAERYGREYQLGTGKPVS